MFARKNGSEFKAAEVNVIPFIDLLSVCISFLLLTAVWLQAGVLSTKQGLGTEAQAKKENNLSVWVELESKDAVKISTQGMKPNLKDRRVSMNGLVDFVRSLKQTNPELRTGLVLPNPTSGYDELIKTMDSLRKAELIDVGIAPI